MRPEAFSADGKCWRSYPLRSFLLCAPSRSSPAATGQAAQYCRKADRSFRSPLMVNAPRTNRPHTRRSPFPHYHKNVPAPAGNVPCPPGELPQIRFLPRAVASPGEWKSLRRGAAGKPAYPPCGRSSAAIFLLLPSPPYDSRPRRSARAQSPAPKDTMPPQAHVLRGSAG